MNEKYSWTNHVFNFLAVILGVYLAFWVNERSKVNEDRKESMVLMNSLVNDLAKDIKLYEEFEIPENVKQQENIGNLLELMASGKVDDIGSKLIVVFQVENYSPTNSTYSSMKSSCKLTLINNLNLQKELSDYYEGLVFESIKKGEFQAEYFTTELLSWLTNNVDLLEMKLLKRDELIVLRNKLIIYESLIEQKVNSYTMIVEDSEKLISSIQTVLSSR